MMEHDPYAPRPDASKRAATKHRATTDDRRPTDDLPLVSPLRRHAPIALVLIAVLMIGAASYQLAQLPSARPLAITPVSTAADAAALAVRLTDAPTATPAHAMIDAYAAPDGSLLGQIEETRQIIPVAHYGSSWIQADVSGSGLVWLRAVDAPDLALVGPDLAPRQAQQGRGLADEQPDTWTPPAPTPVPPAEPDSAPWPVSAPAVPDLNAPNIKEHFNAPHVPRAPGQEG